MIAAITRLRAGRRWTIAGGLAVAAVAPVIAAIACVPPAQLAACPSGEDGDFYTGTCVPYLVPNTPGTAVNNACPSGVSGAECLGSTGNQAPAPAPFQPSPEEQELQDIATPGY